MADSPATRRLFILGNPDKTGVQEAVDNIRSYAESRCHVVGTALGLDGRIAMEAGAEFIAVIGGDGTLLAVSRSLGKDQVPLAGVNFGKLGFLAEFTVDELKANLETILTDQSLVSNRMILHMRVIRRGGCCFEGVAINDCVIQAGRPFRVIQLEVAINSVPLTTIGGDGLIVCTPVGSTAHNLSAGGPIMQGGVSGIALTPLCPHSLTHRPLVVEDEAEIEITVQQSNPGTTVMVDGQEGQLLEPGDRLAIKRFSADFKLVRNPAYPKWYGLVTKLRWGQRPSYEDSG